MEPITYISTEYGEYKETDPDKYYNVYMVFNLGHEPSTGTMFVRALVRCDESLGDGSMEMFWGISSFKINDLSKIDFNVAYNACKETSMKLLEYDDNDFGPATDELKAVFTPPVEDLADTIFGFLKMIGN